MRLHYWPEYTPEGHQPVLPLAIGRHMDAGLWNPSLDRMPQWLKENWPNKSAVCTILLVGGKSSERVVLGLHGDDPTPESVAYHITHGMRGWRNITILNAWSAYLQLLANEGYRNVQVICDIEGPFMTRDYVTSNGIKVLDVYNKIYSNDRMSRRLPKVDLGALNVDNHYGNVAGRQAMAHLNHWATRQTAAALYKGLVRDTLHRVFPGAMLTNYNFCFYSGAPILEPKSRIPYPQNVTIDEHSSPVLYLKWGGSGAQYFPDMDAVKAALACVADPVVPFIEGLNRIGQEDWGTTEENFYERLDLFKQRGIKDVFVF